MVQHASTLTAGACRVSEDGVNHRLVGAGERATGPFVFCCEHASKALPGVELTDEERALVDDHWGSDIGAAEITERLSKKTDSVGILSRISRLWIDLNRVEDSDTLVVDQCAGVPVSFNVGLTDSERADRLARYHAPYHRALDALIADRLGRGPVYLISIHSYTPVWEGTPRPMEIGVLFSEHTPAVSRVNAALKSEGFVTALNAPYSGQSGDLIYSAMLHGERARIPYLELEIRQDLIRTPESAEEVATRIARSLAVYGPTPGAMN